MLINGMSGGLKVYSLQEGAGSRDGVLGRKTHTRWKRMVGTDAGGREGSDNYTTWGWGDGSDGRAGRHAKRRQF